MTNMLIVVIFCLLYVVRAAIVEDEIEKLPGWHRKLPSRQYSGLIDVTGKEGVSPAKSMKVHYYYIESEGNPETDPVILFSNGGPGASSMFGLLTEMGPFQVNQNSFLTPEYNKTEVPSLFYNEKNWAKLGNLLIFDWPPPTGFSYCNDDPEGDGFSCGDWDDERQALVSFAALEGFFAGFPERMPNGLFLAGESYAGVYIPKLTQQILDNGMGERWNVRGVAVGDACSGTEVMCGGDSGFGPWYNYLFLYGHGQFSNKLWDDLLQYCGVQHLQYSYELPIDGDRCTEAQKRVSEEVGGYYIYALYDDCTYQNEFRRRLQTLDASGAMLGGAVNDYICGGSFAQTAWTMSPAVRKAINVPVESNFVSGDNAEGMNYELTEKNLMPFYERLAKKTSIRTMVYNGDADPSINSFAAQNWTSHLDLVETNAWRGWTIDGCKRMGGYVTNYEGDFSFVTIRGSGHMVPTYKADAAFAMMEFFLGGDEPKPYVATCVSPESSV